MAAVVGTAMKIMSMIMERAVAVAMIMGNMHMHMHMTMKGMRIITIMRDITTIIMLTMYSPVGVRKR